jgi:hypothetical protein
MFAQKSVLARLLANENITVQQGNYETAYFDVDKRVLGLPLWKDMGKDVFDMLVGHEIAHALFTPTDFHTFMSEGIPHSWLNIVEDVRIEKLVLRKYPGLVGNFKRGYTSLMMGESDLFGIKDKDLSTLGFMDRLNIHAKARDMIEVPFAADELPFVAQAKACETYEDVVQCCRDIQAWLKQKAEDQQEQEQKPQPQMSQGKGDGEEGEEQSMPAPSNQNDEEGDEDGLPAPSDAGDEEGGDAGEASQPTEPESGLMDQEAITETNFNQNASKLNEEGTIFAKGLTRQEAYASIVPYALIAEGRRTKAQNRNYYGETPKFPEDKYVEFLTDTKRVVNLMVKEFEMRKAAYRSLRARESTKGTIDVNKLHKYQYDDMLFKQVSHLADAKNHGMVMLIDYSGSMYNSLSGVIRQTLTLLMFCKRVGIPFEVYSFTSVGGSDAWKPMTAAKKAARPVITRVNSEELALLKLFDSTMTKRDYDEAFRMMFWQSEDRYAARSTFEDLGNTPLNTALMAMQYVISDFREKHRVQKMNLVTLTDGDSNSLHLLGGEDIESNPSRRYSRKTVIEVNGKAIQITDATRGYGQQGRGHTAAFVKAIGDMGVATINYFIASRGYELNGELSRSLDYARKSDEAFKAKKKEIRDTGVAIFDNNAGYDRRFILPADKMNDNIEDLEVDADMTVAKIAKAFSKSNGSKKKSKVLTQKFAELVA